MDKPDRLIDLDFKLRRAGLVLLYLVIFGLAIFMITRARPFIELALTVLSPFIVALIVAYMFNPVVSWLQRRLHLGRIGGVVITYALILCITAGFFAILLPILYTQLRQSVTSLVNNFPRFLDQASHWLQLRISKEEMQQAKDFMEQHFDVAALTGRAGNAINQAVDTTRLITRVIGTTISLTLGFFAFVSFVVVICFYFLLDYGRMEHVARVLLPDDKESKVFGIWAKIDTALGGFLRGQLIVATTVGVLYSAALFAMGMREYAILIGFLAGFGNLIPYLGPILGGVPAGLWVLFGDTYEGSHEKLIGVGLVVLLSVSIQSLDGFFMQPRIVGKNAELHPLLVLLALLIGAQFGLGGLIIAVPVAIMVRVVLKELWWDPLERQEYENKRLAGMINASADAPKTANMRLPVVVAPEQRAEVGRPRAGRLKGERGADGIAAESRELRKVDAGGSGGAGGADTDVVADTIRDAAENAPRRRRRRRKK